MTRDRCIVLQPCRLFLNLFLSFPYQDNLIIKRVFWMNACTNRDNIGSRVQCKWVRQVHNGAGTGNGSMTIKSYVMSLLHKNICVFSCSFPFSLFQTKWLRALFEDHLMALGLLYPWRLICEQGGITCRAIDEPRKSSKAIDKRVIIDFRDKNVVIARFWDQNDVFI